MSMTLNEPPQGSATISHICLRTDEETYSLVHLSPRGKVQTVDRDELLYEHVDGRTLHFYREDISEEDVSFVNLAEEAFAAAPEDLQVLYQLYDKLTDTRSGVRVYWQDVPWQPPHQHMRPTPSERMLIQKIITAASYLGDYALQWEEVKS